jgi:hypothetical protein
MADRLKYDDLTPEERQKISSTQLTRSTGEGLTPDEVPGRIPSTKYDSFRKVVADALPGTAIGQIAKDEGFKKKFDNFVKGNPGMKPAMVALSGMGSVPGATPFIAQDTPESDAHTSEPFAGTSGFAPKVSRETANTSSPFVNAGTGFAPGFKDTRGATGKSMVAGGGGGFDDLLGYGKEPNIIRGREGMIATKGRENAYKADAAQAHVDAQDVLAEAQGDIAQNRRDAFAYLDDASRKIDREQRDKETEIETLYNQAADKGVDPGRHFRNMDTGTKVAFAVGAVASGMLSAMQGSAGNPFMDAFREHVRFDIAAQEKDIDQAWKRARGAETAYERMRIRGIDQVTAGLKAYDMHLASLEKDLQARMTKATIPEIRANLQAALEAAQMERQVMADNLEQYAKNVRSQRAAAAAAAAERRFQHDLSLAKLELDRVKTLSEAEKNSAEARKHLGEAAAGGDLNKRFVPMLDGQRQVRKEIIKDAQGNVIGARELGTIAIDPEQAKKKVAERENSISMLQRLEERAELMKQYHSLDKEVKLPMGAGGAVTAPGRLKAAYDKRILEGRIKALDGELLTDFGSAKHLGALDEGYVKFGAKTLGSGDAGLMDYEQSVQQNNQLIEMTRKHLSNVDRDGSIVAQRIVDVNGNIVVRPGPAFTNTPESGSLDELRTDKGK